MLYQEAIISVRVKWLVGRYPEIRDSTLPTWVYAHGQLSLPGSFLPIRIGDGKFSVSFVCNLE